MLNKKKIGRMIPYPVIENGRKVINIGPHRCQVCQSPVRRFRDTGYGFEVLERLQVVGGLRRFADQCPVCHSSSRERLIWFWLSQADKGFRFARDITIAHFAPEKGLTRRISEAAPKNYTAYDFEPSRYRHIDTVEQADLSALPMADDSVDLLICNHVLEHVPDVDLALAQIRRVLKPGGTAILQVPLALKLEQSIELPLDSTGEERIRIVGQDDHLRLFTPADYLAALERAGFTVERYDAFEDDDAAATAWMIDPFELLYLCHN
ncbi:class I SAM-dependent methyltransferase [Porphyrobacter sp. YT40]|uniref:class I SAM-dependent methyltransferase n=1 Tax=Porphyrobacter sp. YT40 TaxID=2547601 RepID=UPI0011450915|nr:class I SAM-dependent methyltransferase [Porphyrobacter sp. YT40]QDH33870.1 methyltransferase domain-containing protein [Porphyrobacter sp. YT40]